MDLPLLIIQNDVHEGAGLLATLFLFARQPIILAYIAVGITTATGLQGCINMGVALGLLPTKGLALPFLSYGGSSLIMSMASIGILMNIGKST